MSFFKSLYLVLLATVTMTAGAATTTLSPGANLTSAVESANNGDVIQLNPGVYTPQGTAGWPGTSTFAITKGVKIVGLGSSPADVVLRGGSNASYAVMIMSYFYANPSISGNPDGATLENLTIDTANGGIQAFKFATGLTGTLSNVTIKDVVINTAMTGGSFGILLMDTNQVVIDNVFTTTYQSGLQLINASNTLIMNTTVTSTGAANATGVAVFGGQGNVFTGNTIGQPKANPAQDFGYSFDAGGVVFYNSQANRFDNNVIQGHRDDGLDFTTFDLTTAGVATVRSTDNYIGKNAVTSTGYAAGRTAGSGIWINCSANNSWLFGNDAQGTAECGTCVWLARNNLLLGNSFHNNRLAGVVVSGGAETPPFCPIPSQREKPLNNVVDANSMYFNGNEQVVIRNSDATSMASNFLSGTNGFGGATQVCATAGCQAAFLLEGDPANGSAVSSGVQLRLNTSVDNPRGLQGDDGKTSGFEMYGNRLLNTTSNRFVSTPVNIDSGSSLGGNFWSVHGASGNPSATPFTGVFHDVANNSGNVVDRFPFQTEDRGLGHSVTVKEPLATTVAAAGTRRTVRWNAPGCTYVDILLDQSTLLNSNWPNLGYAVVTIPVLTSPGSHTITVKCKNSAAQIRGSGSSAAFSVTSADLKLMSPGRDDVFNAGQVVTVGWKKSAAVPTVDVLFSTDGGSTYSTLVSGQTGTSARITIPAIPSTAYAMVKVVSNVAADTTDGVFAVRGASGAGFANVPADRKFVMGQLERLEWASPQNSRLVDISATVGATTKIVATNLPDRGNFDWIVPDLGVGAVSFTIHFKTTSGDAISSASLTQGSTLYATTITFGAMPSLAAGGTASVSAVTNSGSGVSFTSLTTSVCTVTGSTVSGVANGICTVEANASAGSNHAAAKPVTQSFTVGTSQTITFGAAPTLVVNGSAALSATASSGLPVSFSSLTSPICTVSGSVANGIASGTCTIAANQAGDATFSTAPQVTQSFSVLQGTSIARLANISTRGQVQTGDGVMIGGFIINGAANKKVLIRAIGPNLVNYGISGNLPDPKLELYEGPTLIGNNDNWQTQSIPADVAAISATGLAPANGLESALLVTLKPGVAYTAVVTGVNVPTGVGIVEVFEADHPEYQLINISTRGRVQTGEGVMIGGFIIQGDAPKTVLIRAVGPNLANYGVSGVLTDPTMDIYRSADGVKIAQNDDWQNQTIPADVSAISATGLSPVDPRESAILLTLPPGAYTAVVSGKGGGTGVGIVEVFAR